MNYRRTCSVVAGACRARGMNRLVLALLLSPSPAFVLAQPAPGQDDSTLDEVMVTASRITRAGFEAPTPTTVITAEDIDKAAPVNIADYVNTLPQLIASSTPQSTFINIAGGLGGANILNLRGLEIGRAHV